MNITTEITRKDIVAVNMYVFPRLKANWVFLGVMVIAIAIYLAIIKKPYDFGGYLALAVSSVMSGFIAMIVSLVINIITMLLTVGSKSGVLGEHQYQLTAEGIRESTEVNESLQHWSAIVSINIYGSYMLIRISSHLFHIIPKRAFQSEEMFMAFYEEAVRLKSAA
jgi:hypothetical protein